jgi:hypothetical protein
MDGTQFDCLTQSLLPRLSRRGLGQSLSGSGLAALLAALGLTAMTGDEPSQVAAAGNCKKIKDKRKRKRCLRKARELAPTCNDGIANGSESDVDCGGSCSRCANGKRCIGRDDCIGALCLNNVCTSCSAIGNECFSDSHGPCTCQNGFIGPVCTSSQPLAENVSLADCPPGTTVYFVDGVIGIFCFGPCGGV